MKRGIIALGYLLIFASGWAFGQASPTKLNGTLWKGFGSDTLGSGEKAMYVTGFEQGFIRGMLDGAIAKSLPTEQAKGHSTPLLPLNEKQELAFARKDAALLAMNLNPKFNFSAGEIASEMNAFYGDYQNAPVCWGDALVFSVGSLEGHPPNQKELSAARVAGANGQCGLEGLPSAN